LQVSDSLPCKDDVRKPATVSEEGVVLIASKFPT